MADRARPPDDISPRAFFTAWVPESVEADAVRRRRLGDTEARLSFELVDAEIGEREFTLHICRGSVRGEPGGSASPDLVVRVDVATWRALNRGELSAPEALLRRRVHVRGDLVLALKLHLILG